MKKYYKSLAIVAALAGLAVFSGCAKDRYSNVGEKRTNILGIYEHQTASFEHPGVTSFDVRTRELYADSDASGDRISLLWGLLTIRDY